MKLKSSIKKKDACRYAMTAEVDAQDVDQCFMDVFAQFGRKAKMPGFRPGKAPIAMVESAFADDAREEVTKQLVGQAYSEALAKHEVRAISFPKITNLVLTRGKKMTFTAEFDTEPQVKLKKYQGIRVKKTVVKVADEEVDKTLDSFRQSRAQLVPLKEPRPVLEGDAVRCQVEVLQGGKTVQAPRQSQFVVKKTEGYEKLIDGLIGMNTGEEREIDMGSGTVYRITLEEVQHRELPAIDDAFAVALGKKSLVELKDQVRSDLAQYQESRAKESMREQIIDKLAADHELSLPESLVARQKEHLAEQSGVGRAEIKEEERQKLDKQVQARAERQVKMYYLLEKIAEEEKIAVEDADVERRVQETAVRSGQSPEEIRREYGESLRSDLRREKTLEHLLSSAEITEAA